MLGTFALLLSLAAAPAPGPFRLVAPGLDAVKVSRSVAAFANDSLVQSLSDDALQVVNSSDVATLLGLERQRQLSGCTADAACVVELANALGGDAVLSGSFARFDETFVLNVRVVDQRSLKVLASFQDSASEAQTPALLGRAARALRAQLRLSVPERFSPQAAGAPVRWPWLLGGGVVTAAGAGLLAGAFVNAGALRAEASAVVAPEQRLARAQALRAQGTALEVAAGLCLGVGLGAVLVGVFSAVASGPGEAPQVSVSPIPGGGAVQVSGVLP